MYISIQMYWQRGCILWQIIQLLEKLCIHCFEWPWNNMRLKNHEFAGGRDFLWRMSRHPCAIVENATVYTSFVLHTQTWPQSWFFILYTQIPTISKFLNSICFILFHLICRCSRFETEIKRLRILRPVRVCQACYNIIKANQATESMAKVAYL